MIKKSFSNNWIKIVIILLLITTIVLITTQKYNCDNKNENYKCANKNKNYKSTNVNIGSFLNIEDFFNECKEFPNEKEDVSGGIQGKSLLPVINTPFPTNFSSEGHLVKVLSDNNRDPVETIRIFRDNFVTDEDFEFMKNVGVKKIRLPVGWWIFEFDLKSDNNNNWGKLDLIEDPYSDGKVKHVPGTKYLLNNFLTKAKNHNLSVLIDLHALQGGSSKGSYNGVSGIIKDPLFWKNEIIPKNINNFINNPEKYKNCEGLKSWIKIINWVKNLPPKLKSTVSGLCPMNEPAHILPDFREKMLDWLSAAIKIYKYFFYNQYTKKIDPTSPRLYINLIETAWGDYNENFEQDCADFMHKNCDDIPKDLISLDVHKYIAWDDRTKMTQEDIFNDISKGFDYYLPDIRKRIELSQNKYGLAVSEWSASWDHISSNAIKFDKYSELVKKMYRYQTEILGKNMELFFWSLKMPGGHTHRPFWSFKYIVNNIL